MRKTTFIASALSIGLLLGALTPRAAAQWGYQNNPYSGYYQPHGWYNNSYGNYQYPPNAWYPNMPSNIPGSYQNTQPNFYQIHPYQIQHYQPQYHQIHRYGEYTATPGVFVPWAR